MAGPVVVARGARPDDARRVTPGRAAASRALVLDVAVYGVAAAFAAWLLGTSEYVTFRGWAGAAGPVYLIGVLLSAMLLAVWHRRPRDGGEREHRLLAARILGALGVTVGAVVVPLVVGVHNRAADGPQHAQSEVVVIEAAAASVVAGHDPYGSSFESTELDGRAEGIREHFPYLPGMVAFGLPRVAVPGTSVTDARIAMAVATTVVLAAALALSGAAGARRLRAWQLLVASPMGALPMVTGGHDLPVLALCLLGLVLLHRARMWGAVAALAVASLLKLIAWPVALAAAVAMMERRALSAAATVLALPLAAAAAVAVVWPASLTDLLAYPAGLTEAASPVTGDTPGTLLLDAVSSSSQDRAVAAGALLVGAALVAAMVLCWAGRPGPLRDEPPGSAAVAATRAAVLLLALVSAAPVARPGYLLYPASALVWLIVLLGRGTRGGAGPRPDAIAATPAGRANLTWVRS